MMKDNINPDHYKNQTSLECIEAMIIIFGQQKVYDFCICNAWKYIWRWKNKNGKEDLIKARWYIEKAAEMTNAVKVDTALLDRMYSYIKEIDVEEEKEEIIEKKVDDENRETKKAEAIKQIKEAVEARKKQKGFKARTDIDDLQIVRMHEDEGKSFQTIAKEIGCAHGTVVNHYHKAKGKY